MDEKKFQEKKSFALIRGQTAFAVFLVFIRG